MYVVEYCVVCIVVVCDYEKMDMGYYNDESG